MDDYLQGFEASWKRFETNLRGKLLARAKQQEITMGLANVILKDASASWLSMYDANGKWLLDYTKENADKGPIITDILKSDMRFTGEVKQQTLPSYIKYAVPAVGALIGGGIAHALSGKMIVMLISAVIPAAALYPALSGYEKNAAESGTNRMIDDYLVQLDVYKNSIISILQN